MNSSQQKRILLVENLHAHETSIRDVLAPKPDWSIACVHALGDAEETLRTGNFDIVLCDVCLPDGTGGDVVRCLHDIASNVPIVVVCDDDEQELGDDALSSGAVDRVSRRQLTQPFLAHVVDDVVRIHSMERHEDALTAGLHVVSDTINTDKPLDQTLDSVLIGLSHVVDYESAAILLTEEDGYRHIVAARGFSGSNQVVGLRIQVGRDELFDEMTRTHQPIVIFDARNDPRFHGYAGTDDTRGWIGVPLILNDTVIGVMTVDSHVAGLYNRRDAEIVSIFANQAAVAIENAQLIEKTRSALSETRVLYNVARSLIRSDCLDDILQAVVDGAVEAVSASALSVAMLNLKQREMIDFVTGGPHDDILVAVSFDELWEGLTGWVVRNRRPALSSKATPDPRESEAVQRRRRETNCGSIIVVPLQYRDEVLGTMTAIRRPELADFLEHHVELMVAMANQAAVAMKNAQLFEEVQHLARTDDLTGLHNRRHFSHHGHLEFSRAQRYDLSLSAIMMDIDHFKRVNDTWGHAVGDAVLVGVAQRLGDNIREMDVLGRYGGEEFSLLLPETEIDEAAVVASRLCRHIADRPLRVQAHEILLTMSAGVAARTPDVSDLDTLLDRADVALYMAKRAGRNCVKVWQPTAEA